MCDDVTLDDLEQDDLVVSVKKIFKDRFNGIGIYKKDRKDNLNKWL